MSKEEFVNQEVILYETRQKEPLPAHNKGVLRDMLGREFDFWEREEDHILNDNNRFHDDR
jgi:hypothetical protein